MAFDYILITSATTPVGLGTTGVISAAVYDSTTNAVDTSFEGVINFSLDTTSVGSISFAAATAQGSFGIASISYTAASVGSVDIRANYDTVTVDGTQSRIVHPRHLVITSSLAPLASGDNRVLVAEILNSSLSVDTADNTTSVTFSQSGSGTVASIGAATAVNGIASRLVTGDDVGLLTISATATSVAPDSEQIDIANSTRVNASGAQGKWFSQSPFRITLWDTTGANRGRGSVKAVITDAKYIGVSAYLNEGGEMFFTLPYNHPQVNECQPLLRHYRVERWDEEDGIYRTVGNGLLQDYEASDNEVVFYGVDYLTALNQTVTDTASAISGATVTYNDKTISTIFQSEMSVARTTANSRLGFVTVEATINPSTKTYDFFTAGEQRTDFLRNICNIAQEGTTTKVVFGNRTETPTQAYNSFFLDMNYATATNNSLRLVYGGNVKRFSYSPNFKSLRTRAVVIATSIYNGITPTKIWSAFITSSLRTTYGMIDRVDVQENIISANTVSARAAYNLYQSSEDKIKYISVSVVDGSVIPFKSYKLGDDIRVIINRGIVNINTNLTLRGQQWVGREDGSEEISFDFFNRSQRTFEISPYIPRGPLEQINIANQQLTPTSEESGSEHLSGPKIPEPRN